MKLFVSYSHKDIKIKKEIKNIFLELKKENLIEEIWDDKEIRHGDEFDKKIFENLIDSDIALFIVTHNLWQSHYITHIEIPIANKFFHDYGYPKIVPVIIEKEAFNETYFPILSKKDAVPQKDKNLIPYNQLKNQAKEVLIKNLQEIVNDISINKHNKTKREINFYTFNNLSRIDKYVKRKQFKKLQEWINSDKCIGYIEGEEGVGKSILAKKFGEFLWDNGFLTVFLDSFKWKGFTDFNELFKKYIGIDVNNEFLSKFSKEVVFILDGVNERENIDKVEYLIKNYLDIKNKFELRGLKFKVKLLFTTRELKNYGLNWNDKYFKINLKEYDEEEFCEAVELYFNDLKCGDFNDKYKYKNIKEMAKYPRYFELTLKLRDKLKDIKNITKEILFFEKLKWMINEDENFKKKLNITDIDDIERKLCKFLESNMEIEKIKEIFGKNYEEIKSTLKEGKIVIKEGGNIIKINDVLLKLSYAFYLMTKAKEKVILNKNISFYDLSHDIEKEIEPEKSDIVGEIYFTILAMYYDVDIEDKDLILFTFYYLWLKNQNSNVTNERLVFVARNLFEIYMKYLNLLETNQIRNHRFIDFDIYLIKILKHLWKYVEFQELKEYLYDLDGNDLEELNKKIAIISENVTFEFLKKINELLRNDKKHEIFFNIWNNLRFAIDGKDIKKIKKENLKEIFYILNINDLKRNIIASQRIDSIFAYLNGYKTDFIDYDIVSYFTCLECDFNEELLIKTKKTFLSYDKEALSEVILENYLSFFANQDNEFLIKIFEKIHNSFLSGNFRLNDLRKFFNNVFLNKNINYFSKLTSKNVIDYNIAIESILIQTQHYKKLFKYLLKNNITHFLLSNPNVFDEFYYLLKKNEKLLKIVEDYYKKFLKSNNKFKQFLKRYIKSFDTSIKKETILFYLSIFHTKKFKQDIKKYLLSNLIEKDNPTIYFFLLTENFEFQNFIFDIIEIDKNREIKKDYIFATTTKERKITGYLNDIQSDYFFEQLEKHKNLFEKYTYEELKNIFEIKGVAYLLIDKKNDLLKWANELIKLPYSYLTVLKVYKSLQKVLEYNQDVFIKLFESFFEKKEKKLNDFGNEISSFKDFEYDLLKIMCQIDKNKSFNMFIKFINDYGIYNDFTKYIFKNFHNEKFFIELIKYVKNDYDIMMLSLLFLRYDKKEFLRIYLLDLLKSDNSIDRQVSLSFLRWFGDDESLKIIKEVWDNDKSRYVRYFAELSYYVCLKEKNFKDKFKEIIKEQDLQNFSLGLLSLYKCLTPLSAVIIEKIDKEEKNFKNFTPKHHIFYQKFIDKLNDTFTDKFEIYGYTLKNYYAGEKLDKYKKIILDI